MKHTLSALYLLLAPLAHAGVSDFQAIAEHDNQFAAVQYGARWPDGVIRWRYNPAGQPAGVTTDQAVSALQKAFSAWSAGCQLRDEYLGTTSATVIKKDGVTAIGWGDAKGFSGYTNFWWDGNYQINEGDIVFSAEKVPNATELQTIAVHEIGHLLGLSHSDQPRSIMFSNPYHSEKYLIQPKGDDFSVCTLLYGSSGLVSYPDLGARPVQAQPGYTLAFYLSTAKPTAYGKPAQTVSSVPADYTGVMYFIVNYAGIPSGRNLTLQLVTPDGFNYSDYQWANQYASAYYYLYWDWSSSLGIQRLPGTWKLQLLDEGTLVGEQSFTVQSNYAVPKVPALAGWATPSGDGRLAYSAAPLRSADSLAQTQWMLDRQALSGGSVVPGSGEHTLWLAATSGNSRYAGNIPNASSQDDGPDGGLRIDKITDQLPGTPRFSAVASGIASAVSLDVTWQIAAPGKQQLYLAAILGQSVYYRSAEGWTPKPGALLEASGPGWAAANAMIRDDLRGLPSGIPIYAGYGTSVEDMLAKNQFGLVYTLP